MTTVTPEPVPVLLVDDDRALIRTLEDILPLHGFAPVAASTGRDALKLAADRASSPLPPLALVDLRLPDMDGIDLAMQLHAQVDIQIVILTGFGTVETAIRALRDEGCDYLLKPVDPDLLVRTLRTAESRWRLHLAEGELRRTQQLLRGVFDASPLPIAVLDESLRVRLWNRAAEVVFGRPMAELIGQPLPDHEETSATVLAAVLRGGKPADREMKYRRPDAALLDLRLSAARLGDASAPGGVVVVYEDTTHRRRLESQVQDSQRLDAMGRLVGGVAHDFNNLLSVILMEIGAARAEPTNAGLVSQALESIHDTAQRGATLTKQLLSFARQQPAELGEYVANDIVTDLARLLSRLAGDRIDLQLGLGAAPWPIVVDRGQLEQVITNFVVNARDAMPDGGRIDLTTENVVVTAGQVSGLEAGEWVRIAVTDTGTGMPEEVRARIFEPFYTTKPRGSGTGLGLATCHGIVERFQGVIAVDSTLGVGSTFAVYLPRARSGAESATGPAAALVGAGTETVLLVEDQPQLRAIARMTLSAQGYTVLAASTATEALRLVEGMEHAPDLVFVDAGLPDMSGQDLIKALRRRYPTIRTLITSGSLDIDDGTSDVPFLPKPYSLESLRRQVRAVLDQAPAPNGA